jgi:hypothetical protein
MNWDNLKPKNKWVRFGVTLGIGMAHYCSIMALLHFVDPVPLGVFVKVLLLLGAALWTAVVYVFMDWFNGYSMLKSVFLNGEPKTLKEWFFSPKQ